MRTLNGVNQRGAMGRLNLSMLGVEIGVHRGLSRRDASTAVRAGKHLPL
jgi:hypothetical protein